MSEKSYHFDRQLAFENSKFNIFFDSLVPPLGEPVSDYLVISPKRRVSNNVAGVCVVPVFNSKIALMSVWRHHLSNYCLQAPAGFVEEGESPCISASRELQEETGLFCPPDSLVSLGAFLPDAGLIDAHVALFLAFSTNTGSPVQHEIGSSPLQFYSLAQVKDLIYSANNIGGSTLVALFRSIPHLSEANVVSQLS